MIKIKVTGERRLSAEMRQMQRQLGLKGGEWADYAARAVRDGVVRNTQPFGTGRKARDLGEGAVRRDLFRCFRVVADSMATRRGVITGVGEARDWHQSRRNGRGRVRRGKRKAVIGSTFQAYEAEVLAKVGMAKASVAGGDDARLKSRMPRWLRPWVKTGDAGRQKKLGGAVWTFKAEPRQVASDLVLGIRGVNRVMRKQDRIVMGAMKRDLRRLLKKQGREVNR